MTKLQNSLFLKDYFLYIYHRLRVTFRIYIFIYHLSGILTFIYIYHTTPTWKISVYRKAVFSLGRATREKKKYFSVRRVAQEQLKRDSICGSSCASYLLRFTSQSFPECSAKPELPTVHFRFSSNCHIIPSYHRITCDLQIRDELQIRVRAVRRAARRAKEML